MLTKISNKNSFISAILFFVIFSYSPLFAQTRPSIDIKTIPENYTPNEQITITISSFNVPLDSSEIEWFVNEKSFRKGAGVKQIKLEAPSSGETKEVLVLVTQKNQTIEERITLRPETLDIYIESVDGYIPVWYLGRAQTTEESVVKVVAVPNSFNAIDGDNRVYTWSKNNFKDAGQSGRGRQAFITKLSPFENSENITVGVGDTTQTITLRPYQTNLSLYEYSPLVGTRFEKELTENIKLTKEDVTFEVIPWFFSAPNRNSNNLNLTWTLNGLPTKSQSNRSLLNLRRGTTQKGKVEVGVSVKHKERTLQSSRETVTIDL